MEALQSALREKCCVACEALSKKNSIVLDFFNDILHFDFVIYNVWCHGSKYDRT